ncbi:PDDEXK nuclease domain-containing protein [Filifactor villosus]|uniref:PDDEXK nuclease domain-containing protein n=1 Tax=Filifactor villosus TaxID=29374 RepID=A0ABV9QQF6_9FIRM
MPKKYETDITQNKDYKKLVANLKEKIADNQFKAALEVNYQLLDLYWYFGREIVSKQKKHFWGKEFIPALCKDLEEEFPDMEGFSIQSIRNWYKMHSAEEISSKVTEKLEDVESLITSIPWEHNLKIMSKCQNVGEALFYTKETISNEWSPDVLENRIDSGLYEQGGDAVFNFDQRLPKENTEFARGFLKTPCKIDLLPKTKDIDEDDVETLIAKKVVELFLELGGFSYIGQKVALKVGQREFFADLLFYHVKLHSYVVVQIKMEDFKPEFIGKLSFYASAIDRDIKTERDNQTIGILICKSKDNLIAQYSLDGVSQPIGISEYEIGEALEEKLKSDTED